MNKENWDIFVVYAIILTIATALLYLATSYIINSI